MLSHNKIFLTGFMAAGKSTLGKKLAQLFQIEFIDLDQYIEQKNSKTVTEIFKDLGEVTFRELESKCLEEIFQINKKCIVALGGGTVCFHDNLVKIKENGLLIYLQLPSQVLAQRLKDSATERPLVQNLKDVELMLMIEQQLKNRSTFYEQADLIINGLNLTEQILHDKIIDFYKKNSN